MAGADGPTAAFPSESTDDWEKWPFLKYEVLTLFIIIILLSWTGPATLLPPFLHPGFSINAMNEMKVVWKRLKKFLKRL